MAQVQTLGQILQKRDSNEQQVQQTLLPDLQRKTMLIKKYGERENFITKFNPSYQMQICGDSQDCYFGDYPTLAEIKWYGKNTPVMWLIPQLYNLSEYCGVKEKLEGAPLEETAFVIATEFYYLKISEIMLFFHRFKTGRYGRFYGNVDPLVITTSIRDFIVERNNAYMKKEQEEYWRKQEESRKNAVTWEEYCKRKGIEGKPNPLEQFTEK